MTAMTEASEQRRPPPSGTAHGIARTLRWVACAGLCFTLFAGLAEGPRAALGVGCGAGLAVGNLWVFGRVVTAFLEKRGRTLPWVVVSLVKILALFAVAFELMKHGIAPPLALAIGYGSMPVGIVGSELFGRRDTLPLSPIPGSIQAHATPSVQAQTSPELHACTPDTCSPHSTDSGPSRPVT